jgi:Protein of unknown function (DUF3179)
MGSGSSRRTAAGLALAAGLFCLAAGPPPDPGSVLDPAEGYALVRDLIGTETGARRRAAGRLIEARDETLVPGIVDGLFFVPSKDRGPVLDVLEALTGEQRGRRYLDWVEYVGSRTDLEPKEGYAGFKGSLLARIDPRLGGPGGLIREGVPARIRLEEVVWGGVRFEGIPALDRSPHLPAAEAGYLRDDEIVFGVSAGGEHRAYPRRILSWHEMANDVVGGEPVTVSYCTLCGSAVLYSGRLGDDAAGAAGVAEERTLTFGTSGLLYRSNKLMVDRDTGTLWSNLTGEAVIGRLARTERSGPVPVLRPLPITATTWGEWRTRHPGTTVLALDEARGRRWGFDYRPGAADAARQGVSFPVWRKSGRLDPKTEVYTLRLGGVPKAYPLDLLVERGVVNDTLGGEDLVLVSDPSSGAVRVYRRGGLAFRRTDDGRLVDGEGGRWTLTEEALEPPPDSGLAPLPRLPGANAFWFGWFGFYPTTEVFE